MKDQTFEDYLPLKFSDEERESNVAAFSELMQARRTVRDFAATPVPRKWIEKAIQTASSAPSGANRQPWKFVAVSNPEVKQRIRLVAEEVERQAYEERMPEEWLDALRPLGTGWRKPYLEAAPWLVAVFAESYGRTENGSKVKHYYVQESVGIACGLFIAAIQQMGLITIPYTPSPMRFLSDLLNRPEQERPFLLFPVGFPAKDAQVPRLSRKPLSQVSVWIE